MKDKDMRFLRVDQVHRVILAALEAGNVYLFLWVDHHDKAYEWAAKHLCRVNRNTGTVQLYAVQFETASQEPAESDHYTKSLFKDLKDKHLLKLGVPNEQLSLIKTIKSRAIISWVF